MDIAALQRDALACLDQAPRKALEFARRAYDLASKIANDRTRAETALTLAIVLNRMGEFREALATSRSAAADLEKRGESEQAARCYFEAAWAQTFLGHLKDALADAERARGMDASDLMNAHFDWIHARVLRDQGNYPEAEKRFERSRAVFESAGMSVDAARCLRELAHTYLRGERVETLPLLQSVRKLFESANCPLDEALCDWLTGLHQREANQYSAALETIDQARAKFARLGTDFFVAYCDNEIGIIYLFQNQFKESLGAYQRARDYFLSHDVPVEVSACDINLGLACDALNRYDEALTYYREAADLALAEGREVRAGRIFNNMGRTYGKQGLYAQAMDFHQRALQIYSDKGLPSLIGSALVRLAMACRQLGQYDDAIEHLRRAREEFLQIDLPIALAECEFNLADVYLALRRSNDANIHLQRAREIYAENKLESSLATCNRLFARIASENGDQARARSLLAASRATFLKHHQIVDAALCDLTEGELSLQWNEYAAAQDALGRARATLSPAFPDHAWRADYGLGRCARQINDRAGALRHYLRAVRTIADSRSRLVTEQLSNDFFGSRRSVYQDALDIAGELDAPESALETIEASKARTFLSLIQNRAWNLRMRQSDTYIADLMAREKDLRYRLDSLRARTTVQVPEDIGEALRGDPVPERSIAALQELKAQSQQYEAVVTQLRLASTGLGGISAPAPFALNDFRRAANNAFRSDWAALDYYLAEETLFIVTVRPNHLEMARKNLSAYDRTVLGECAAPELDLRELIYRGTLHGESVPSPGTTYLQHLYRLLIPRELDAKTLIIAPHGVLHALPFQALIDPCNNTHLIEQATLIYTPSLQVLQHLLKDKSDAVISYPLVMGISEFGEQARALPSASAEVDLLREIFASAGEYLYDDDATRQRLLDLNATGKLGKFDLLHFATHAVLDPTAPHQSRVLLQDNALTVLDILDLTLDARLVTLSACQTALGKGGQGDELIGLARAFFYAGAHALLATLWQAEDRSMLELAGRFYRHLTNGKDAANALRDAQIEMIQDGYAAFQWASLVLMGQP